jgi:hypothetical protein
MRCDYCGEVVLLKDAKAIDGVSYHPMCAIHKEVLTITYQRIQALEGRVEALEAALKRFKMTP